MKKLIFIFFVLILTNRSFAQETPFIDSLKAAIAKAPDDSNKVNALYKLGTQYELFRSKQHVEHFISAVNLAKKIGYKRNLSKIYNSLTTYLFYKDIYDLSIKYSFEHLALLEEQGLEEEKYKVYTMLGNLAIRKGDHKEAKKYYSLVMSHRLNTDNKAGYANSLVNMLIVYMECKEYDSAIAYGFRAVELYRTVNMQSEMANALLGTSEALIKKKSYEAAEQKVQESYSIYKAINLDHGMCNTLYVLGQVYGFQNKTDTSIKTYKASLKYATALNLMPMERDCYKSLAEQYAITGDFKNAYLSERLFKAYEDSIGIESQKGKMLEVEVKYDISKKENLLLEQKVEIESKDKQRNLLLLGLSAILLLLFISFRAYKQKKNSSEIIAKQKELVEDKQKEILDSINYAKRIQSAILAREEDIKKHLPESFLLYRPKDIIAGDFYFFEVTDTHIFYAAADCTGHGVPGALMSVVCSNSLTRCVKEFGLKKPGEILDKTRELVVETLKKSGEEVKDGMDISLIAFSRTNMLENIQWAGANNPLWYIKNNALAEIKGDKQPIGLYDASKPFTSHPISLNRGDMLFLFTDGYADQFGGPKGKKFKYKQFQEVLESISSKDPSKQVNILEEKFLNWKGELEQVDDVCVIGIRV